MYIPIDYTQNRPYCRLLLVVKLKRIYTKINEPINQNSIKVPNVVKPTNKKLFL